MDNIKRNVGEVEIIALATKERKTAYKLVEHNLTTKERNVTFYADEELTQPYNKDEIEQYIPTPFELFGVECGKGWEKVLQPIFDYVEEYNKDKEDDGKLIPIQIKEKFGTLRVYMNFETDELSKLIEEAECNSYKTCEMCGSTEDVGMIVEGWLTTKCHKCVKEQVTKSERPCRWKRNSDGKVYWINPNEQEDEIFKGKEC